MRLYPNLKLTGDQIREALEETHQYMVDEPFKGLMFKKHIKALTSSLRSSEYNHSHPNPIVQSRGLSDSFRG